MMIHSKFIIPLMFLVVNVATAATVAPRISRISVTPATANAGATFKFSTTLTAPLIVGDKVKINVGSGTLIAMTGTETQYSLSQAIFTTGVKKYTVGIYTSRGALRGAVNTGTYKVTSAAPVNHAPTLTLISSDKTATTNTKYTVTLNAKDADANLNAITMNWGDNSEPETLTATDSKDLIFSHTYTTADSFGWNAFATDKGTPVLNSKSASKIVTVSNPAPVEIVAPPAKTTGYTKISNDGSELSDAATLGTNPTDWACTKDNKTGLIWEVKTDDSGLHDKDWTYSWYEPDMTKNGGLMGTKIGGICVGSNCNTFDFANKVNEQNFCGTNNWRRPTNEELISLIDCSDNQKTVPSKEVWGYVCTSNSVAIKTSSPTIDSFYFPNTVNWYWTSSYLYDGNGAWVIYFSNGLKDVDGKEVAGNTVRLVHNP